MEERTHLEPVGTRADVTMREKKECLFSSSASERTKSGVRLSRLCTSFKESQLFEEEHPFVQRISQRRPCFGPSDVASSPLPTLPKRLFE